MSHAGISCLFQLVQTVASLQVNMSATKSLKNSPNGQCQLPSSIPPSLRVLQKPAAHPGFARAKRELKEKCWCIVGNKKQGFRRDSNHTKSPSLGYKYITKYTVRISNFPFKNHHVGTIWMKHQKYVATFESQFNLVPS